MTEDGSGIQLAYRDDAFLDSNEGRPVRILSEYLGPLRVLEREGIQDTIVFFGSARAREGEGGVLGEYYDEARALAAAVTRWSRSLEPDGSRLVVCSGGSGGIMEAANRGAKEAGGRTIGLNIGLPLEQRPNRYVDPGLCFEFHYFFMRKLWFAHLARAIVAFPGGFGTLDEVFEILTLRQTRKIQRDIGILLYGTAYWTEVVDFDALERHGVISAADRELIHFVDTTEEAMRCLMQHIEVPKERDGPAIAHSQRPPCGPGQEPSDSDTACK